MLTGVRLNGGVLKEAQDGPRDRFEAMVFLARGRSGRGHRPLGATGKTPPSRRPTCPGGTRLPARLAMRSGRRWHGRWGPLSTRQSRSTRPRRRRWPGSSRGRGGVPIVRRTGSPAPSVSLLVARAASADVARIPNPGEPCEEADRRRREETQIADYLHFAQRHLNHGKPQYRGRREFAGHFPLQVIDAGTPPRLGRRLSDSATAFDGATFGAAQVYT